MKKTILLITTFLSISSIAIAQDGPGNSGNKQITCKLEEHFVQNPVVVGPISSTKDFFLLDYKGTKFIIDRNSKGHIRLWVPLGEESASTVAAPNDLSYNTAINSVSVSIDCSQK